MPFWWRRRRKPWYGPWYKRRRFTKRRRKPTRRRYKRKYRRAPRRRRRRRRKVRRKKPSILVKQWQPDSIVKCKIRGIGTLVLGAEGTQYLCYTNQKDSWTPPQQPGGGGFGVEKYNLSHLYDLYCFRKCIWTKTNQFKDLCRYLYCKFTFYRHQKVDFIVNYSRQPPFFLDKYVYSQFHPVNMILSQHKKFILSKQTKPKGKLTTILKIKPPKQMLSKWFFQEQFAPQDLCQIAGTACSLSYPRLGCCNENQIISVYYLNPEFFQDSSWAQYTTKAFLPYQTISHTSVYYYKIGNTTGTYTPNFFNGSTDTQYYESINNTTGWFSPRILNTYDIKTNNVSQLYLPINAARYNPEIDDGRGNEVYLVSVLSGHYQKPTEQNIIFKGQPLWLTFFGLWSYIKKTKQESFLNSHMFVIKSPYILPVPQGSAKQFFPFVDYNFIQGNNPYKSYITSNQKKFWYPTAEHQVETINAFVQSGPYITKLQNDRDSTWELPYLFTFYFKWGGPQITDQQAYDPKKQDVYNVPDTVTDPVQVSNPLKQTTESLLHCWDFRRGLVTNTALKRMRDNLQTDSDLSIYAEKSPKKKRRAGCALPCPEEENQEIKTCLQALSQENTYQEEETPENLKQLIQQQQQQQRELKYNLLKIIHDMKIKQKMLQLQTGVLE
nr:MAG: ORF1 [Torque teno midi virus]